MSPKLFPGCFFFLFRKEGVTGAEERTRDVYREMGWGRLGSCEKPVVGLKRAGPRLGVVVAGTDQSARRFK